MTWTFRRLCVTGFAVALFTPASSSGQVEIRARAATVTIGGRLHVQAITSSAGAPSPDVLLRRARVSVGIEVTDFFEARLQPDFADDGEVALQDGYLSLNFDPAFEVAVGQMKRPSEIFGTHSSTQLSVIERDGHVPGAGDCTGVGGVCTLSQFTQELGHSGRDIGLWIAGSRGGFSYTAAVTNGPGMNVRDENHAKSYSGRGTWTLASELEIGGFIGLHDYPGANGETEYGAAYGVDLDWGDWYDGFHLLAAVVGGDNWMALDALGGAAQFLTGQVIATYQIPVDSDRWTSVEPLARISWADPDTDTPGDDAWLFTPGLMLYVSGRNRIGANLDVYAPERGDTELSLKVQAYLYF